MVTNERGYPLEFRVTTPVRPTGVQKALYGKSLEPYVVAELLVKRLLAELKQRPALVLANRLGALEVESPFPIAFVARANSLVRSESDALEYRRIEVASAANCALGVLFSRDLGRDIGESASHLERACRYFDPVEAFDRMNTALGVLAESDSRYR
jgi:hypothetical protein